MNDNRREHPIRYASLVVSDTESEYPAFERESLGVIFAVKKFRHYLISNKFKFCTDHQALKNTFNNKDPHGQITRWFTLLAEYNFGFVIGLGRKIPEQISYLGPSELIWL